MRIGIGYDSHRFEEGRPLFLGGVHIPGERGLKGHSDADVLIHALIDAILGASAMGDIGLLFPDTDDKWKGASSIGLLEKTIALVSPHFRIVNADATVICERPRLRPYIAAIKDKLSSVMHIPPRAISIKGKTNEKMDAVGAGEGIIVHAAVLLEEKDAQGQTGGGQNPRC